MKRLFDIFFSLLGIVVASPIFLIISLLIKIEDGGPVFFRGKRVGKEGKVFRIFKFRTMVRDAESLGGPSTSADDERLTRIGRKLRSHNLDELPQFIDVLRGKMSFVGPRPEVPQEVETYDKETREIILSMRPGITDLATLEDIHEEEILKGSKDPHQTYRELIKPKKLRLAKQYVKTRSFWLDIKIILRTVRSAIL